MNLIGMLNAESQEFKVMAEDAREGERLMLVKPKQRLPLDSSTTDVGYS